MKRSKRSSRAALTITEWSATTQSLGSFPRSLKSVAFFYGYIANDLSVFQNLLSMAAHTALSVAERPKIYRSYSNAQAFSIARVLAGKTVEGWDAVGTGVDGILPLKEFRSSIDKYEPDAVRQCGVYFGRKNPIRSIRNGFAFHMDPKHWMDKSSQDLIDRMGLQCFLQDEGTSFYATSENLLATRVMSALGHGISLSADDRSTPGEVERFISEFENIISEIIEHSQIVTRICNAIVSSVIERAIDDGANFNKHEHIVRDAEVAELARLPVFLAPERDGARK